MAAAKLFLLLLILTVGVLGRWVKQKIPDQLVAKDHDYWVIKADGPVNRPTFPAFIRIYGSYMMKSEVEIDCSSSPKVLYHKHEIIFLTTGHRWHEGGEYYITLDEGVLSSMATKNSSAHADPVFWRFTVPRTLL